MRVTERCGTCARIDRGCTTWYCGTQMRWVLLVLGAIIGLWLNLGCEAKIVIDPCAGRFQIGSVVYYHRTVPATVLARNCVTVTYTLELSAGVVHEDIGEEDVSAEPELPELGD